MDRIRLPEFIEVLVPSRGRNQEPLRPASRRLWQGRLMRFMLEELGVTGLQESKREGVWKQAQRDLREYDPRSERLRVVREEIYVMRASCTRFQVTAFRKRGEPLLIAMGRALNQEAVAYETREGLTILIL